MIIGLLIGALATIVAIIVWCFYRGEQAYFRPRIFKMRAIWVGALANFAIAAAYFTIISVLSYYFQVSLFSSLNLPLNDLQIRGSSALRSGVQLLPLIAGVITALVLGGGMAPKVGYANPFVIGGMLIFEVALGCLTLLNTGSSTAEWAGLEFMAGFGSGLCFMM